MDVQSEVSKQCEICLAKEHKYCCPKCGTKTCSLECVKQHKQRSQCDGVVDNAVYVPRGEFQEDERLVQRDYNFLSRLNRTITVQKEDTRHKNKRILNNRQQYQQQNKRHQRQLTKENEEPQFPEIIRRGVHVRTLPKGMQRSVMNKSMWDKKLNSFVWSVEYILLDADTGEELQRQTRQRVKEETKLIDTVPFKMLEELKKDDTEEQTSELFLFLKLVDKPASAPEVITLDTDKMLAEVLKEQTVIEYPTFLVSSKKEIKGFKEYVEPESSESDTDSSDSDSDSSDSDSSDNSDDSEDESDDGAPEEESAKLEVPPLVPEQSKPIIEVISTQENDTTKHDEAFSISN